MQKNHSKTTKFRLDIGKQLWVSEGPQVASRRRSIKLKLDGNIARRNALSLGVTWDTELPGFGLRKRKSGRLTWVVKYRKRGEQRMATLGSAGRAAGSLSAPAARAEARRLLAKIALTDLPTAPKRPKVPLFADYAEEFWLDYSPHWKPSTRTSSRKRLDSILMPRFSELPINMIVRADINHWRDSMAERGGAFNRCIPIMSVMMQYAEKLGYRPKGSNPCRGISRFKRDPPERHLTAEEYRRLGTVLDEAELPNPYIVLAIRMLLFTGARVNEIATLRWRSVQIPRLALPDSKTGPKIVHLNPQAIAVIESCTRGDDEALVFPSFTSDGPINLGYYWTKLRRKAALPDVRLHDFRHSFASVAIAQGIPLATIGKLLGHALPETTARYAHLADEVICESANRVCASLASSMGLSA